MNLVFPYEDSDTELEKLCFLDFVDKIIENIKNKNVTFFAKLKQFNNNKPISSDQEQQTRLIGYLSVKQKKELYTTIFKIKFNYYFSNQSTNLFPKDVGLIASRSRLASGGSYIKRKTKNLKGKRKYSKSKRKTKYSKKKSKNLKRKRKIKGGAGYIPIYILLSNIYININNYIINYYKNISPPHPSPSPSPPAHTLNTSLPKLNISANLNVKEEVIQSDKKKTIYKLYIYNLDDSHSLPILVILKYTEKPSHAKHYRIEGNNYEYLNKQERHLEKEYKQVLECYGHGEATRVGSKKTSFSFTSGVKSFTLPFETFKQDNYYLILEFNENYITFYDYMISKSSVDEIQPAFQLVVKSITHLHRVYSFVHGDLKTDNVFLVLDENGEVTGVKNFDFDFSFYIDFTETLPIYPDELRISAYDLRQNPTFGEKKIDGEKKQINSWINLLHEIKTTSDKETRQKYFERFLLLDLWRFYISIYPKPSYFSEVKLGINDKTFQELIDFFNKHRYFINRTYKTDWNSLMYFSFINKLYKYIETYEEAPDFE